MTDSLPLLYSFRRCPYAIRARVAIYLSGIKLSLREVLLNNKPDELIDISPKATVPVVQLPDGQVIDESLDILHWAFSSRDTHNYLAGWTDSNCQVLVAENDGEFKQALDHYKYSDRHPESAEVYRLKGERFLQTLDARLSNQPYLQGDELTWLDVAIFPFIRQFAYVDINWFQSSCYDHCQRWLSAHLEADYFTGVMAKTNPWVAGQPEVIFP